MLYLDIKSIAILGAAALLFAPQEEPKPEDPPKVTLDETGDFHELVRELGEKFGGRVRLRRGIPSKEVSIKVKDAGFFEALDALCRAHKEATYCPLDEDRDREGFTVASAPWVEYKSSYHGHFKVAVVAMKRIVQTTPLREDTRAEVELALFGPPWVSVSWNSGNRIETLVDKAVAADGRDLLIPEDAAYQEDLMDLAIIPNFRGNVMLHTVFLKDFDLSKGLKTLSGTMKLTSAESREVRVACEAGVSIETPRGRLSVDGVKELERDGEKSRWRITLSFTPPPKEGILGLTAVLLPSVSYDGNTSWNNIDLPWRGWSFLVETTLLARAPAWIKFKVQTADRLYEIPFRFSDLAFRDY